MLWPFGYRTCRITECLLYYLDAWYMVPGIWIENYLNNKQGKVSYYMFPLFRSPLYWGLTNFFCRFHIFILTLFAGRSYVGHGIRTANQKNHARHSSRFLSKPLFATYGEDLNTDIVWKSGDPKNGHSNTEHSKTGRFSVLFWNGLMVQFFNGIWKPDHF